MANWHTTYCMQDVCNNYIAVLHYRIVYYETSNKKSKYMFGKS